MTAPTFLEFFSGLGGFRAGLGPGWRCTFANDVDPAKNAIYAANWGRDVLKPGDVARLAAADLPRKADLAVAGFPCQDLSLAGQGAGLNGERSGVFWELIRLLGGLRDEGRAPTIVLIENVAGLLTASGGRDFAALCAALVGCGYSKISAAVIDAIDFTAQSRPRVFVVAVRNGCPIPAELVSSVPIAHFAPPALLRAAANIEPWVWWRLPTPPICNARLIDILDDTAAWDDRRRTEFLIGQLSAISKAELDKAGASGERAVFAGFRRTRPSGVQIEIRTYGRAGCLRVASGGSSRQLVIELQGARRGTRYLSPRECARLMALDDSFRLPAGYDGLNAVGDAVCVAAVSFLERNLLFPLIKTSRPTVHTPATMTACALTCADPKHHEPKRFDP